ncbi:MAG TPA: sigma 54-interacting transcriptional regulator [Blastocatellia bacterium]|jgi:DNA-binding NtrC family response regulator
MDVLDQYLSTTPLPTPRADDLPASLITEKLVGISGWAEAARRTVAAHAAHDGSIIIEGEPGTGKEFLARLIHECSPRRRGPFVAISFDSVSEESAEAVLFGVARPQSEHHFTPRSLLESAHGGTLYINGLMEMGADLKAKIANFIRRREYRLPGEDFFETRTAENSNVRILLGALPENEKDTNDFPISDTLSIPPLRRRREDIEPMVRHFIRRTCDQFNRELREVAPDAMAVLRDYDWPGNIIEIKSVVNDMIAKSGPPLLHASLIPGHIVEASGFAPRSLPSSGINLGDELERIEKTLIVEALKMAHGVQYKAAQLLGLKPTTLNMKISRFGIDPKVGA